MLLGIPCCVFYSKVQAVSCQELVMTNAYCNKPDGLTFVFSPNSIQRRVTLSVCHVHSNRDIALKWSAIRDENCWPKIAKTMQQSPLLFCSLRSGQTDFWQLICWVKFNTYKERCVWITIQLQLLEYSYWHSRRVILNYWTSLTSSLACHLSNFHLAFKSCQILSLFMYLCLAILAKSTIILKCEPSIPLMIESKKVM